MCTNIKEKLKEKERVFIAIFNVWCSRINAIIGVGHAMYFKCSNVRYRKLNSLLQNNVFFD